MSDAAPAPATNGSSTEGPTPAEKLMQQHDHHVTVEDVPDEEDLLHPPPSASTKSSEPAPAPSEKAAGKQKADDEPAPPKKAPAPPTLNTASEELFPALGAVKRPAAAVPSWGKKPASLAPNGQAAASGASTPASGAGASSPAAGAGRVGPAVVSLPGQNTDKILFYPSQLQKSRPIKDILRDINRRSKATVEYHPGGPNGVIAFTAKGPKDAVRQTLQDVANEVGAKTSIKHQIPASVRPYIIGKGGSKIQEIQKSTGARIQVPKQEQDEDEDAMIDITIDGNALTVQLARHEIDSIVKQHTSTVNLRLKDIPAEYYPFLAGPHNSLVSNLENDRNVRVNIPHYTTWNTQAPAQASREFAPQPNLPISIAGDREHAQQVQAELERQAQRLRQQLAVEQQFIDRGRHQFIVGDRGGSLHDFLERTGCSLIVPPSSDDSETIYVVGPEDKIADGVDELNRLADAMQQAVADATSLHRGPQSQAHAHNLTRYLRQRQALEQLERAHNASIFAPKDRYGPTAWQIYSQDRQASQKARNDIQSVFASHPPSRFSTVNVNPFYHRFLRQRNAQQIRDDIGVHVVFPEDSDDEDLILVYEGRTPYSEYSIPRGQPPASEVQAYQEGLRQAQEYIQNLTRAQNIVLRNVAAPPKFHPKIERYVEKEQQGLPRDVPPVQVSSGDRRPRQARQQPNTDLAVHGPSDAVEQLLSKIAAFIEQEEKDERERGYTTTFDFPQKFANQLIGRRGEHINKLREEFDVDIQINDGQVEIKGPQAKAHACKAHILSLLKRLEDEATYTLKIKPQYHRDLIGAKGNQVNRLQDRYNVRINFPRSNKVDDDDAATEGGASQRNFRAQGADEVTIRGPRRGADEAREELLNLLQWTVDNSHTDTISVAQSQIPMLIGAGGREMENLRLSTGAQIDVPGAKEGADPSGRAEVKIKGTQKQVQEAKKALQERVKVFDDTVVETFDVDRKHHRTLIGSGGSNIRQIVVAAGGPDTQREIARMVRFPRAESEGTSIRVEGPKDVVAKVVASIKDQAETLASQVTEILEVTPDKHRLLIGRGGDTRRALESKFNIQLDVPKVTTTGAARNQVKITGESAAVEKAKEHILDLVKSQEGETIQVPQHLHHSIAENGTFFKRLRNDHKVTVDHAGHQIPSRPAAAEGGKARKGALPLITDDDAASGAEEKYSWEVVDNMPAEDVDTSATIPWILRGPADNLPQAIKKLEAAIEAAKKPKVTGYLILPDPRSYRLVVGPGGSTINGIRRKTGTNIFVPRDQAHGEAIEVSGPKEGVEEARKLILEAVSKGRNGNGNGGRK